MWRVYAEVFLGWLAAEAGDAVAGVERMQRAIEGWQATGMASGTRCLVAILAETCLAADAGSGRPNLLAAGLAAVDAVLGPDKAALGLAYEPEIYRLKGELLLARDGIAAAAEGVGCFNRCMTLAKEKRALGWELRAAMSLVRLRGRQGEAHRAELHQARACLAEVYGRFGEGFAFPDLQEAAALLHLEITSGSQGMS